MKYQTDEYLDYVEIALKLKRSLFADFIEHPNFLQDRKNVEYL